MGNKQKFTSRMKENIEKMSSLKKIQKDIDSGKICDGRDIVNIAKN